MNSCLNRPSSTTCLFAAILFSLMALVGCATTDQNINSGLWHYNAGLWGAAAPRILSAVPELEQSNPKDPRLPTALIALGEMATASKKYDRAEDFYRRAMKAAEAQEPSDDRLLRNSLVHAGCFYLGQKRFSDAEPLLKRAVAISERDSSRLTLYAIDLDNLGQAYAGQGRYEEAMQFSQRALKVFDQSPQDNEALKTRGVILYNLGYFYSEQKQYLEAETLYRKALEILAPPTGEPVGEKWRINHVLFNYAIMLRKLGRGDEAAMLEQRMDKGKGK